VLLTPYPDAMTRHEVEAFNAAGFGVTAAASLGLVDEWASVSADEIRALVDRVEPAALRDADAVVLSCTGWRTLHLIPELESALGRPVLSSVLALATHAVTLAPAHAGVR
jgi:maleate isomerase